jgi:predicted metal-dependent peptidase
MSATTTISTRRRHYFARYANAAITRVWVPVDSVGSMTGAKNSEWLTGISCSTRPAASARLYFSASMPPTPQ